jgi:hypothetical protein
MSKYDALGDYLRKQTAREVRMTFAEIEKVVGHKLPRSAYAHRPWWSNNESNSVITKVWLNAGFRSARVDMEKRRLVFERAAHGVAEESEMYEHDGSAAAKLEHHPLIGSMKGTFTIEPGWDLTKPALDPEELDLWEANLDRMADELEQALSRKKE